MPWNWKALFEEAHRLLKAEVERHEAGCGCQDIDPGVVEGPCPGLPEAKKFLEKCERIVKV